VADKAMLGVFQRRCQLWVKGGSYGGYSTLSAHHPKADPMK